ncbi:MAG: GyrI-like domain-containing protein, partial [Ferruginibacter sp.]|nr:GyrI-like domain-containing protein [Chitinophagaceae bacterium]
EMKGHPTINDIYGLVDELNAYIKQKGAAGTGNPMLNIFTKDSITYLLKVAIPVNKKLPPSGNMSYRWMLGGGNILITSVKGGDDEIQKAFFQIQQYISDYKRVAPAIPFQSLVTDRRNEPDSSKWITWIYYPVM